MPVDLLGLPVAAEQTAQDSHAAHPGQLLRHAGVGRTLPLTWGRGERQANVTLDPYWVSSPDSALVFFSPIGYSISRFKQRLSYGCVPSEEILQRSTIRVDQRWPVQTF